MSMTTSDRTPTSLRYYLNLEEYSEEKLKEILDYLAGYETKNVKTDDDRKEIIRLFLLTFSKLTALDNASPFDENDIALFSMKTKAAYMNIYSVSADMPLQPDITVIVFNFLRGLEEGLNGNELSPLEESKIEFFGYLAGIEFLFKLKIDDSYLFPIGTVLKDILGSRDMLDNVIVKHNDNFFFIIRLALMVFRVSDENDYEDELNNELQKANLDFLLSNSKTNVHDDWIYSNFRENKVFVLITCENGENTVHIHAASKKYFGNKDVLEERTAKGVIIGYNWRRKLSKSETLTSFEELIRKKDSKINRQLVELLFDKHQRNIFAPGYLSFDTSNNQVLAVNPFTEHDEFIIDSVSANGNFETICRRYYANRLAGIGLNSLSFGFLYFLNQISNKPVAFIFDAISNSSRILQNEAICQYLEKYPEDLPELMKKYEQAMSAIVNGTCKIEDCMFYPIYFDFERTIYSRLISKYQVPNRTDLLDLNVAQVTINSGIPFLKMEDRNLRQDEVIGDIPFAPGTLVAIVRQGERYSIEDDYKKEVILLCKIREIQYSLVKEKECLKYNHFKFESVAKLMDTMQWQYLNNNKKFASSEDMCMMRLANHIANCLADSVSATVNKFLAIVESLPRLKGETLCSIESELISKDNLVVLKTTSDYGSTCSKMLDEYIAPEGFHKTMPWYAGKELHKNNQERSWSYTVSGNPAISKIIFLYDNAISGRSTMNSLRSYFQGDSNTESYIFRTRSSQISLKTLIHDNKIKSIDVIIMYATACAETKIEDAIRDIRSQYAGIEIKLKVLNKIDEDAHNLYENFKSLYKGEYLDRDEHTYVLREFNQPKKNWLDSKLFQLGNPNAIFILDEPEYPND